MRHSATLRRLEDYTNKYKGEQVEIALFGGEYQEGVLTAYCSIEDGRFTELCPASELDELLARDQAARIAAGTQPPSPGG